MENKSVLLAFSGGTDSCYSARKLAGEGYRVEGLVLDMTGDKEFIGSARRIAGEIGLPLSVVDVKERFARGVVDYFITEYTSGRTPAPCTVCNPLIKWKTLYETAIERGFDHIATGHYFRTVEIEGQYFVRKAADVRKDQSYYLWMLPQTILRMALTPMGEEIKSEILGKGALPIQKESMGVCFLGGKDYREFVRERCPDSPSCRPGVIRDGADAVAGSHEGCAFYTTGQKKNLGLPPGYAVTAIDASRNEIRVGPVASLFVHRLMLTDWIIAEHICRSGVIPEIKIRGYGLNPAGGARFVKREQMIELLLNEPAYAPAVGQPVVFYDGDMVVGGGFIESYG